MPPRVAIIGAGISGLAHADVLQRCGFSVVLYERAPRVGGVWARAYPEVSLQNSAPQYHLADLPWPFPTQEHPTGVEILRYLDHVVTARRLDVRLGHEVRSARERAEGGWRLSVRAPGPDGTPQDTDHDVDHLVVSIGQYTEGKHRPALDGEADFPGQVLTEREIGDLGVLSGKQVVVVGFGKSALDMACFAAARGASVRHLFRTPRWTIPRRIFGVHMTHVLFNRFGSVMMPCWTHPTAPERLLHRIGPVIRGFWAGIQALIGGIHRAPGRGAGPEAAARLAAVMPEHPLVPDLRSAAALAPDDYYRRVVIGEIQPVRGEIAGLGPDGVRLLDGRVLPAELVVLSVGSKSPAFPFLAPEHRALLEGEPDGVQLYRHLVHPRIPTLGFAGYNHGFMHVAAAEVGALWLAALWRGELELPPVEEMERAVAHVRDWKRAHIHFEPSRSCAINTRFQQYLDILLQDLGVSPYRKLPNVLAEVFVRYGAADYAGVVEEYLRRPKAVRRPVGLAT